MKDVAIVLEHRPGALAEMAEALGRAWVSIEGGGAFAVDGRGAAHFIGLVLAAAAAVGVALLYNSLIGLRNRAASAWSDIEVQLERIRGRRSGWPGSR